MPWIDALRLPAAYPHKVAAVELFETHISWVLLTGEYAYKIKKPVNYGFVDASTLERRREFCEREIQLNGRLAPWLYLDVQPITGTPESPQVGGAGTPFEYAVRMRQFDQDALLSTMIEQQTLTAAHIDDLARTVAVFHNCIARVPETAPWGTPQTLLAPVQECCETLLEPHSPIERERIESLEDWMCDEHQRLQQAFANRRQAGFIRECHGDMHLGNMLLYEGQVHVFDGIEFNESLRWIDVFSEIAFVTMDLADRGRPDFAWRFLNQYLEFTGDYAGLLVFRFYQVYRALVRAKVACLRLAQSSLPTQERQAQTELCKSYVALAEEFSRHTSPALVLMHGFSGSGKSRWSQPLLEHLPAIRLRSDVERKRMFGVKAGESTEEIGFDQVYHRQSSEGVYDRLVALAEATLTAGYHTIIDATLLKRAQRNKFWQLAVRTDVPCRLLDCHAPPDVLRDRIRSRMALGGDASEATPEVLEKQLQSADALNDAELKKAIVIDTTRDLTDASLETLVCRLREA